MLSVFTLPFDFRAFPFDWLIVCLILLNIVAVIALFAAYIQFKVNPPLPKFNIHSVWDYLREFTWVRNNVIFATVFIDTIMVTVYILYILARIIHLILFGSIY